jgi:hypothetical protein
MRCRPLTHAECLEAWRVDSELNGGYLPSQTIGFVSALMDLEDDEQSRAVPGNVILAGDCEPRWLTRLRARFGR